MAVELDDKRVYRIGLANGQSWHIVPTEGASQWVEKLAAILQLEACDRNEYPKLIFVRREKNLRRWDEPTRYLDPTIHDNFPRSGWKARRFPVIHIWTHRNVPDVICEMGHEDGHELDIVRMWLSSTPIFQRAEDSGGLPFHAALVERDGLGILLAASGNTGKSTCCRSLPPPWYARCDDETLVVLDEQKGYLAHPFPTWSDVLWRRSKQTWSVEKHTPLSAIFFLEQADIDEVAPMGRGQAAVCITQSAMQVGSRNWMNLSSERLSTLRKKLFDNACELAESIPAFQLRVSLNGRFWEEIEKVL